RDSVFIDDNPAARTGGLIAFDRDIRHGERPVAREDGAARVASVGGRSAPRETPGNRVVMEGAVPDGHGAAIVENGAAQRGAAPASSGSAAVPAVSPRAASAAAGAAGEQVLDAEAPVAPHAAAPGESRASISAGGSVAVERAVNDGQSAGLHVDCSTRAQTSA